MIQLTINNKIKNNMKMYFEKLERRRRFVQGPAGSWLGFPQPVCFTLQGMAALDSLRSFLSFHSLIHQGLPFDHHCPSLWSPMSPFSHQGIYPFGH